MVDLTDEYLEPRLNTLHDLFTDTVSLNTTTQKFAAISLADGGLDLSWNIILTIAIETPEYQDKLVDLLVSLSELTDEKTEQGQPLKKYNMQVWKDLPMLAWMFREEWDVRTTSKSGSGSLPKSADWEKAIAEFINLNHSAALLVATEKDIFNDFSYFAMITFRSALETPSVLLPPGESLDAYVPAAVVWIEVLGVGIYESDDNVKCTGGSLWKGEECFCEERWVFWRRRLAELVGYA